MAASVNRKLPEIFDDIWKVYEFLDTTEDSTTTDAVQNKVKEGIADTEKAVYMVNILQLFSDNENIEEVKTSELQYLLLSAFLGYFTNKNCKDDRQEVLKKVQQYYVDFLKLCKNYEVTDVAISSVKTENSEEGSDEEKQCVPKAPPTRDDRQAKIVRYKQQKETEQRLKDLYPQVKLEHVDDEVKREYFQTLLKRWVNHSLDELESIESELPILEHMAKMRKGGDKQGAAKHSENTKPKQPMRPFIITRDAVQKKVYGLGYPSIPTYSLEEFYEQQIQQGGLPDRGIPASGANDPDFEAKELERSEVEKEEKVENDDEEALKKAREWDEWRDTHRRGWGNTDNKG